MTALVVFGMVVLVLRFAVDEAVRIDVRGHHDRLKGHPADRARTGVIPADLRVHRAPVLDYLVLLGGDRGMTALVVFGMVVLVLRFVVDEAVRIGLESALAVCRAEMEGAAAVPGVMLSCGRVHAHTANRVQYAG